MRVAARKIATAGCQASTCRWLLRVAGSLTTPSDVWQPVLQVGPEATVEIQITDNQQMAEFDFHM